MSYGTNPILKMDYPDPDVIRVEDIYYMVVSLSGALCVHSVEVDPSTIGQYTGLTDKNGYRLFDADVVTGYFKNETIVGYIIYGSDASFFIQRKGLFGIGLNNASDWIKVIGNVHDNPELLDNINEGTSK